MKLLPPVTLPWRQRIYRRHTPKTTHFKAYRACLRWEFGFTCSFCLCHEADLSVNHAEALGLTQIEHFIPISQWAGGMDDYDNCFYICKFCSRARGRMGVLTPEGERLLNPCADVWGEHFVLEDDLLLPIPGDRDAAYTAELYDFNDIRRQEMRKRRRKLEEMIVAYRELPETHDRLVAKATQLGDLEMLDMAKELWRLHIALRKDLELFRAIPVDYPAECICGRTDHHNLSAVLNEQVLTLAA